MAATAKSTSKRSGASKQKSKPRARVAARPARAGKAATSAGNNGSRAATGTARTAARWTEDQVQILMDAVKRSPTAKAGFERASQELGKTVGTVQQKYYALQRKAGGGRGTRTSGASSRVRSTGTRGASTRGAGSRGAGPITRDYLAALTADDLVAVADLVRDEVHRRQQELQRAADMFK